MITDALPALPIARPAQRDGPNGVWRLSLHGVTAEIIAPYRRFARPLGLVLAAYPAAPADVAADVRVRAAPTGYDDYWEVTVEGAPFSYRDSYRAVGAAQRIEWAVVAEFMIRLRHLLHVHAGLVATATASLLLIGRSGSGKSTTSVALAQAGLALYTDDVALLDRDGLRPLAVPRPIKLDARSRRLLRVRGLRVAPEVRLGESVARTALPGLPPIGEPGPPLKAAVFFASERNARPSLRCLTAAEAALRLAHQSATDGLGQAGPGTGAITAVTTVPCYELTAADLDATVQVILGLIG